MNNVLLQQAIKLNNERKRRNRRRRMLQALSVFVVFCTAYALVLPAITMEREPVCGYEAHTHADVCYTEQTVRSLQCPDVEAEAIVHKHDALCYDESSTLLCTLKEQEEHTHDDNCYAVEQTLTCAEAHEHTDACYTAGEVKRICDKEELALHSHEEDCYIISEDPAVEPELICTTPVVVKHVHAEACVVEETAAVLTCTAVEHAHVDRCYPVEIDAAPVEMTEAETDDEAVGLGRMVCGREEHSHGDDCWQYREDPDVPPVLTCAIFEHSHSAACYLGGVTPTPEAAPQVTPAPTPTVEPTPAPTPEVTLTPEVPTAPEVTPMAEDFEAPELVEEPEAVETDAQKAVFDAYIAEREALEAAELTDEERKAAAEALWARICDSVNNGEISDRMYYELGSSMIDLLYGKDHEVGEMADLSNFEAAKKQIEEEIAAAEMGQAIRRAAPIAVELSEVYAAVNETAPMLFAARADGTSNQQIVAEGGEEASDDGAVMVSKTIAGTDMENVFDITLDVITKEEVNEVYEEPDMAVVIVMDISQTMNAAFGSTTRYKAAIAAAENFIDQFAANNKGASQLGFVAFNTDAHEIFKLQNCGNTTQADTLIAEMKKDTSAIINKSGYASAHSRFTNIEAGLKRAYDMLNTAGNEHKYIIFLSDGFPTTYLNTGTTAAYDGYDPYDSSGSRFYDSVELYNGKKRPCSSGTSYSDIAAQRASTMAATIKNSGATIFSIGVDVNGQSVETYVNNFKGSSFSVVDRRTTNYEVYTAGQDSGLSKFETWLKKDIGSNQFYQSSDANGLYSAFESIFETIKSMNAASAHLDWVTGDPMGDMGMHDTDAVEFLGFYDKDGNLVNELVDGVLTASLDGTSGDGWDYENEATFDTATNTINWDLKNSRYITQKVDNVTLYHCELTYRVRLKNEDTRFVELQDYATNDETYLNYRVIEVVNDVTSVSEQRRVLYPIPEVEGYVEDLIFKKIDSLGAGLPGAEFTLTHDTASCGLCSGDGLRSVTIPTQVAVSDAEGTVAFYKVPSGHKYTLTETSIPEGYRLTGYTYTVEVAYNVLTVTVKDENGEAAVWNGTIENYNEYVLPETGGPGTQLYQFSGMLLIAAGLIYGYMLRRRREGRRET